MKRFKRFRDFEVALELKDDAFIAPPRPAQRSWLVGRALSEFVADLNALDDAARRFVPGAGGVALEDRTQSALADDEIMEDWQQPLMKAMAAVVGHHGGDVLEVGFGRGVSAAFIQEHDVSSHTIIECNDSIVRRFDDWKAERFADRDITIVPGMWQDVTDGMGPFDGIFFHTYPLNAEEYEKYIAGSTTFAEHFFPTAAALLRSGGVFTYMTNEIDSLGRGHQRALLEHFNEVALRVLSPLELPVDLADAWWADSMVIVKATK